MNKQLVLLIIVIIIIIIYLNLDSIKTWIIIRLVILRGVLAPNCFWYKVSDIVLNNILNDGTGVNLYKDHKKTYGDFAPTHMFGKNCYLLTNVNHIKTLLDNSPTIFGVGILKEKFFKSFMSKNVGVSNGCPWKRRRKMNEYALQTDRLHFDSPKYNNDLQRYLKNKDLESIEYNDLTKLSRYMAAKIIFNVEPEKLNKDVFDIFSNANSIQAYNKHFSVDDKIYKNYINELTYYIDNPKEHSLVKLLTDTSNNKDEILHQIPHFIFPIVGLYLTSIPRILVLLINHKDKFKKVIKEVNSTNSNNIYNMSYTRKCILETVRLNNPVISTFRTVLKDFSFDDNNHFKKGQQLLILNNPVLREKEYFDKPNQFIPERWNEKTEKSYYAISFNQGPQRCPGKELVIFLAQSFIYNFIKINNITESNISTTKKIDINNIPQIINPCDIVINVHKTP